MNLFLVGWRPSGRISGARAERALSEYLYELPFLRGRPIASWRAASGRALAFSVATDPVKVGGVEYATLADDGFALFSGRPVWWRSPTHADGRAPLAAGFYRQPIHAWSEAMDGRFVAVRFDDRTGTLDAVTDPLGLHPLYRCQADGTIWIGTKPDLLRRVDGDGALRPEALAGLLAYGWSLTGDPVWSGVRRVAPGSWWQLDPVRGERSTPLIEPAALAGAFGRGFEVDAACETLVALFRALHDWPGRPGTVSLSGGRDSRLILAAAVASGERFGIKVNAVSAVEGFVESEDVTLARAAAASVGRPIEVRGTGGEAGAFADPAGAARVLRLMSSGAASLADALVLGLHEPDGSLELVHTGQGGELARCYYGTFGSPEDVLASVHRAYMPRWPPALVPHRWARRLRSYLRDWLATMPASADPGALADLAYLHQRNGRWATDLTAIHEAAGEATFPLWSARFVPFQFALPAGERRAELFYKHVLESLEPRLLSVPFEGKQPGWMPAAGAPGLRSRALDRRMPALVRREAVRRRRAFAGRGDDPFAPVLAAARAATQAQPDHPAWTVLRRRRIEVLLRRPAWALDARSRAMVWRLATVFLGLSRPSPGGGGAGPEGAGGAGR
jgi:hypothetical protein